MRTVTGLIVLLALCYTNEAVFRPDMAEEMGFIARRQLMVLFDEFKRILDKRPVPKDRVNDACIQNTKLRNIRDVRDCATSVFKDYMATIVKYEVFKDREAKKEAIKAFRSYMRFMRIHRLFQYDEIIPLSDALPAMLKHFGDGDYLNYSN